MLAGIRLPKRQGARRREARQRIARALALGFGASGNQCGAEIFGGRTDDDQTASHNEQPGRVACGSRSFPLCCSQQQSSPRRRVNANRGPNHRRYKLQ